MSDLCFGGGLEQEQEGRLSIWKEENSYCTKMY